MARYIPPNVPEKNRFADGSDEPFYWHIFLDRVGGRGKRVHLENCLSHISRRSPVKVVEDKRYNNNHELALIVDGLGLRREEVEGAISRAAVSGLKYSIVEF